MAWYIVKRALRSFFTLFVIITIVFSLLRLMPIEGYFNNFEKLKPVQIKVGLDKLGLNDPLPKQLYNFYKNLLKGDLGVSNKYRKDVAVSKIIAGKVPLSLKMGLMSLGIALAVGLPLGTVMAKSARSKSGLRLWDRFGTIFIVIIQAVPQAVYYLFIQLYGTNLLRVPLLFQESNWVTWILPTFSLALWNTSYFAMWLRRYMVDESNKDYVRLARAKGVPAGQISRGHIFRNAYVPMVQYLPNSILITLMGSLYVESLYSVPGMGGLLVNVIQLQDNTMVQALVLIYAAISILGLLSGDILMALLDPRISFAKKEGAR